MTQVLWPVAAACWAFAHAFEVTGWRRANAVIGGAAAVFGAVLAGLT